MKINKLKLRGAIGIWKGLGQEEIEIDFSQFGSGLIALTGKNGAGKTTIMENLHPYRCMVSRTGSLQSHFYLKDSYRILEFEHNGDRYESKILIDALTGGSEAYLLQNGTPLNDGKLTTYDEEIESVLGSQELFFNSVFSGQKSKGIAELKPAERRKLFYELLNLNVYETYLENAKAELKSNELKLSEIEGRISAIQSEEGSIEELEQQKHRLLKQKSETAEEISVFEKNIEKVNEEIRATEIEISKLEEKRKENDEIETKLSNIANEIDRITDELNEKIHAWNSEISIIESKINRVESLSGTKFVTEVDIAEIEQLETERAEFQIKKSEATERLMELQAIHAAELEKMNKKRERLNELGSKRNDIFNTMEKYQAEINRNQENAEIINHVPCNDPNLLISKTDTSGCQFLKNAYEAKKAIPEIQNELYMLKQDYDEVDAEFYGLKDEVEADRKATSDAYEVRNRVMHEADAFQKNVDALTTEIKQRDKPLLQEKLKEIENAENNILLHREQRKNIDNLIAESRRNFDEQIKRFQKEAGELQAKFIPKINEKITEQKYKIEFILKTRYRMQEEQQKLNNVAATVDNALAKVEQQILIIRENEEKIKQLETEKSKVHNEIKDWTFLTKAFDKTGIPVLKLENSGIAITAIANELLSLFENQFRIVFETTQLTKDKKKLKETFNINVIAGDDVVEISNLSGGQQVWVETAIQLAISLLVRQQGINIETSFLDEKDGALDVDNAHLYLDMLKLAHQKSGVHNTFVITHRPELIDLISQRITLCDGLLTVESEGQTLISEVA